MPRNPLNPRLSNGDRIREVCEITERLGRATSSMVRAHMKGGQSASGASKACSRAASQGLLLADRSMHAVEYQAAPGWRERMVALYERPDEDDEIDLLAPRFTGGQVLAIARSNRVPSSVWALGANIDGATT